jgi:hypothetical protein
MIIKFSNLILFIFLLSGCQSAMSVFDKSNTQYEKGLQHTKVKPIVYKNETKAIINVSYLNSIDTKKWDNQYQNFLVGIYINEDEPEENMRYINNTNYSLTMNDKPFIKQTIFTNQYKLYENIPLKNPWAKYYIISFNKNGESKVLNLKYKHLKFGELTLDFKKE